MLTYLILICNLPRQKRGVPCSDRLEQVDRWISYRESQQKLLCRWKSTPQNNLTLVSSRNEVAIADLVMNTVVVVQFVPPKNNLYIKYVQFAKHMWSPVACCPNIWCSEGGKSGLNLKFWSIINIALEVKPWGCIWDTWYLTQIDLPPPSPSYLNRNWNRNYWGGWKGSCSCWRHHTARTWTFSWRWKVPFFDTNAKKDTNGLVL